MYLVVVGWLYVVLMLSVAQDSVARGLIYFLFLGFLPVLALLHMIRLRRTRRRQARALVAAARVVEDDKGSGKA